MMRVAQEIRDSRMENKPPEQTQSSSEHTDILGYDEDGNPVPRPKFARPKLVANSDTTNETVLTSSEDDPDA